MLNDRTQIMLEGTPEYPLDPAAAEAAETCPHCSTLVPAGEQFCGKCGYQRGSWQQAAAGGAAATPPQSMRQPAPFALQPSDGALLPLYLGDNTVGRSATDITLSDSFVSRRHAQLIVSAEQVKVVDLGSSNGTFVAEQRLAAQQETELQPGMPVRFGQSVLTLVAVATAPAADSSQTLIVAATTEAPDAAAPEKPTAAPATGEIAEAPSLEPAQMDLKPASSPWSLWRGEQLEYVIPFGICSIGRKPEHADYVLRGDGYVSGLHARLVATLDTLEVCDLGSTNGTYVNGERCEPSAIVKLNAGDVLRLGQTDLTVRHEPAEAATD